MKTISESQLFVKHLFAYNANSPYSIRNGRMMYKDQPIAEFVATIIADHPTHCILFFRGNREGVSKVMRVPRKVFNTPYRLRAALEAVSAYDPVHPRMSGHLYRAIVALSGGVGPCTALVPDATPDWCYVGRLDGNLQQISDSVQHNCMRALTGYCLG